MAAYYLIAQLPSLDGLGERAPLPITEERFLQLCQSFLSKKAQRGLRWLTLAPPRRLDRTGLAGEELGRLYRRVFSADWYLASANAITEAGEIYNVDGNSNRVAAITFGPENVLLVVGCNKIVKDLAAAKERVEAIAAPANTVRLNCATPCAVSGKCEHCHSPARICCTTTIHSFQRVPGRIKVLLVGEPLGF